MLFNTIKYLKVTFNFYTASRSMFAPARFTESQIVLK